LTLDGHLSSDLDGQALTYEWTLLSKPTNSQAQQPTYTSSSPYASFTPDIDGDYKIQLRVSDGIVMSAPVTMPFTATNAAPIARAGTYPTPVQKNTSVQLDGTTSSDANNDPLTYQWTVTAPSSNPVTLDYGTPANPAKPRFLASEAGTYNVSLTVNDGVASNTSSPTTVTSVNGPPTANPGPNQFVNFDRTGTVVVLLDGGASSDPNGDLLSYSWTATKEDGVTAVALTGANTATPSFTAAAADLVPDPADGNRPRAVYKATLRVNDGTILSAPATVTVTVYPFIAKLGYPMVDAEYDRAIDRVVAVSGTATSWTLHLYDPATGDDRQLTNANSKAPLCVCVSPDGTRAMIGHDALVSYIDLTGGTPNPIFSQYVVPIVVYDCILGPEITKNPKPGTTVKSRYAYLMPGTGSSTPHEMDLLATSPSATPITNPGGQQASVQAGTHAVRDSAGAYAYHLWGDWLDRFELAAGPATFSTYGYLNISSSDVWVSEDPYPATILYGASGKAVKYNATASGFDYFGTLSSTPGGTFPIKHGNQHAVGGSNVLAVIPFEPYTTPAKDVEIRTFDGALLTPTANPIHPLGRWGSGTAGYATHGKWVFVKNDGSAVYAVVFPDSASPDKEDGVVAIPLP
jgi:hypothetical protein